MVSHRTKRILRYLGPFLFFVGLAYTALYPERKLLHYTNQEEKATTLFNSGSVTVKDEIPLASCRVWIDLSGLSSADLPSDALVSCSIESALLAMKNASQSTICVLTDRYSVDPSSQISKETDSTTTDEWFEHLKKSYGDRLVKHAPDYGSAFIGTLFEETYVNSADLSFMGPAMIWALLWKHGGLLLSPNTILVSGLKSYYNFIVLNATFDGGSLALTQFTERHHELPSLVLNHFMEQARRLKQVAREQQANVVRMGVSGISDNIKLSFLPITAQEWSHEIEKYCGRALSKNLVKHLCQDTEVVAYDLVPRYHSVESFKRLSKKHLSELLGLTLDSEQLFHQNPLLFRRFCPLTFEKFFKK